MLKEARRIPCNRYIFPGKYPPFLNLCGTGRHWGRPLRRRRRCSACNYLCGKAIQKFRLLFHTPESGSASRYSIPSQEDFDSFPCFLFLGRVIHSIVCRRIWQPRHAVQNVVSINFTNSFPFIVFLLLYPGYVDHERLVLGAKVFASPAVGVKKFVLSPPSLGWSQP